MARGYEQLQVWQRGIALVRDVYFVTGRFPHDERFGLSAQLRRAAVSVPSNIAEGHARHTTREFLRFLSNAQGSLAEVATQLLIAVELQYIHREEIYSIIEESTELSKMLSAMRRSLRERDIRSGRRSHGLQIP